MSHRSVPYTRFDGAKGSDVGDYPHVGPVGFERKINSSLQKQIVYSDKITYILPQISKRFVKLGRNAVIIFCKFTYELCKLKGNRVSVSEVTWNSLLKQQYFAFPVCNVENSPALRTEFWCCL